MAENIPTNNQNENVLFLFRSMFVEKTTASKVVESKGRRRTMAFKVPPQVTKSPVGTRSRRSSMFGVHNSKGGIRLNIAITPQDRKKAAPSVRISPPAVTTRARRTSIYQKGGALKLPDAGVKSPKRAKVSPATKTRARAKTPVKEKPIAKVSPKVSPAAKMRARSKTPVKEKPTAKVSPKVSPAAKTRARSKTPVKEKPIAKVSPVSKTRAKAKTPVKEKIKVSPTGKTRSRSKTPAKAKHGEDESDSKKIESPVSERSNRKRKLVANDSSLDDSMTSIKQARTNTPKSPVKKNQPSAKKESRATQRELRTPRVKAASGDYEKRASAEDSAFKTPAKSPSELKRSTKRTPASLKSTKTPRSVSKRKSVGAAKLELPSPIEPEVKIVKRTPESTGKKSSQAKTPLASIPQSSTPFNALGGKTEDLTSLKKRDTPKDSTKGVLKRKAKTPKVMIVSPALVTPVRPPRTKKRKATPARIGDENKMAKLQVKVKDVMDLQGGNVNNNRPVEKTESDEKDNVSVKSVASNDLTLNTTSHTSRGAKCIIL